ncbi:hypothetical protein LINPERHAP1_LOCUS41109 [Linum perenne]
MEKFKCEASELRIRDWPEEDYPPYANEPGPPGYIFSADITNFIASEFEKHKLRDSCIHTVRSSQFAAKKKKVEEELAIAEVLSSELQ